MFAPLAFSLFFGTLVAAAPGIITIGDSTVTSTKGWGGAFCKDTTGLAGCVNLSKGGTTTVTWRSEPQFASMITACKTPNTYATIQFGHNDQKVMSTTEFAANLKSLTERIQDAGCLPILVTSLGRRKFSGAAVSDSLAPYSEKTIALGKKLGVPVLPLLADSLAYIGKLGAAKAEIFNADYTTTNVDITHLNAKGALYFGRMVADEVKKNVPALASHITSDAVLSARIAAGTL